MKKETPRRVKARGSKKSLLGNFSHTAKKYKSPLEVFGQANPDEADAS